MVITMVGQASPPHGDNVRVHPIPLTGSDPLFTPLCFPCFLPSYPSEISLHADSSKGNVFFLFGWQEYECIYQHVFIIAIRPTMTTASTNHNCVAPQIQTRHACRHGGRKSGIIYVEIFWFCFKASWPPKRHVLRISTKNISKQETTVSWHTTGVR